MDLLTLNPETFYPNTIFEDYNSLIWTERCFTYGDFSLKSKAVENVYFALPIGSLITLRDTCEVMMVETHKIETDKNGDTIITVSGRSLDSFLENRVLVPIEYNKSWETGQTYTPPQFVALLIWNALVNNTAYDPTRFFNQRVLAGIQDPYLIVPNLLVSHSSEKEFSLQKWTLTQDTVASLVVKTQSEYKVGVRIVRPMTYKHIPYNTISFDTENADTYGVVNLQESTDDTKLRFDVYTGSDRSINQNLLTPVVFYNKLGHISEPNVLKSNKSERTRIKILSDSSFTTYPTTSDEQQIGFQRKIMLFDAGNKTQYDSPEAWVSKMQEKGKTELEKNKFTLIADGKISEANPNVYGKDYFLGDTITIAGNYEPYLSVYVSEVIRSQTSEGESTFPSVKQF